MTVPAPLPVSVAGTDDDTKRCTKQPYSLIVTVSHPTMFPLSV